MKIYKRVTFHATDQIECDRIKDMFGINTATILPNVPKVRNNNEALHKMKNELKVIFISRIRDNKNLFLALKALSYCKGDISFDIYGPIEDETYWEQCQLKVQRLPQNISIEYKGIVAPSEISNVMRQYHALLLPTKTENFGHVIVEAMQSGVVPIISDQTPWVNLEENEAGWSLDLKDIESFTTAINTLYAMDGEEYAELSGNTIKYITQKLNIDELKLKYIELFTDNLKGK